MSPTPLYDPTNANAAYQLRYGWTAWPSQGSIFPAASHLIEMVQPLWEHEGIRVLEHFWNRDSLQIVFTTKPAVSPAFLSQRAKGRLDHAGRTTAATIDFSRKLAVRSIGDNTRKDVEAYIARQVPKEQFVDPRFAAAMAQFTISDNKVDLSVPTATASGQYWYNLHLVLVTEDRLRASDVDFLASVRDATLRVGAKKNHAISRLAVMPDHLHVSLRPWIEESPVEVVFAYQNNLGHLLGRVWKDSYYVGTFGEYTTHAAVSVGTSK